MKHSAQTVSCYCLLDRNTNDGTTPKALPATLQIHKFRLSEWPGHNTTHSGMPDLAGLVGDGARLETLMSMLCK